ncbi:MAG: MarR family transcriptional regulator, partial [Syntrophales bacterium]|nr:MarR family transcriptional regulator [Syntrophales bacterium]
MKTNQILFIIGRIQYKANAFLLRELKAHNVSGLAPSHAEILGSLMRRGPLPMLEIPRLIGKDKSTVTALINKLIKLGLVEKARHPDDSRSALISLAA